MVCHGAHQYKETNNHIGPTVNHVSNGLSYPYFLYTLANLIKHFMLVNYDSRVAPDWKIPHIMTLES